MSVMASRPVARWAVPVGLLVAVLGGAAVATTVTASAQASLPPRSPAQLLVDVQTAQLDGASGTVVERADLGLPSLPDSIGGQGSAQLNSLITGSHTLRIWYSGPDKARVALLGATGESDIIRSGSDVWLWSSADNTARHETLPAGSKETPKTPTDLPSTPQQAADELLAALDPTTSVSVQQSTKVAGRDAYQLVLRPKDTSSLVARATIAIDGTRHIPLRVQVFAKGYTSPAFQIGFTSINFNRPDASRFQFSPPPGAKVTQSQPGTGTKTAPDKTAPDKTAARSTIIGKGWTAVYVTRADLATALPGSAGPSDGRSTAGEANALLNALPLVSGPSGTERLLKARLFSVLLTDDGRVLVGAVNGQRLIAVAADPAAALK